MKSNVGTRRELERNVKNSAVYIIYIPMVRKEKYHFILCQEKRLLNLFFFFQVIVSFHNEYIFDNNLKIYSSQVLENLIIMDSKEEFIFSSRIL